MSGFLEGVISRDADHHEALDSAVGPPVITLPDITGHYLTLHDITFNLLSFVQLVVAWLMAWVRVLSTFLLSSFVKSEQTCPSWFFSRSELLCTLCFVVCSFWTV